MKRLLIVPGIICLLYLAFTSFKAYRINSKDWKYNGADNGHYLGDFVRFKLSKDTLFMNGQPVGIVKAYTYRIFDDVLIIGSMDGKLTGEYHSK